MKLVTQFRATLVAIEEKSMTGSNNKYYQLAVLQGSEATSLSCTEEVYKQNKEMFKDYVFGMQISEYEGKKTLRVTGIYDLPGTATAPALPPLIPVKIRIRNKPLGTFRV